MRGVERGSAMVVALLVTVILTLLGIAYLLMAETEIRIAENERLAAQALYAAEAGARQVKRWFDRPGSPLNLIDPPPGVVDRTRRLIDADGDPDTPAVPADGSAARPYYKQDVDRDADGADDLFEPPYRGDPEDALLGTAQGPDMSIDGTASSAAAGFLESMSRRLLGDYPGGLLRARVSRIDVYAPPYLEWSGQWTRSGMATVTVTAGVYRTGAAAGDVLLSARRVTAVLNEVPYGIPFGPIHSCGRFDRADGLRPRWGPTTAVEASDLGNLDRCPQGPPRAVPPSPEIDLLHHWDDAAAFDLWKAAVDGRPVDDPWYRHAGAGAVTASPSGGPGSQPWPSVDPDTSAQDHSNLFQNLGLVPCAEHDYGLWKAVATSGFRGVHYYAWDAAAGGFRENGQGTARSFRDITRDARGVFFFDTADQRPPRDDDGDGEFDNLTPPVEWIGGSWGLRGLVYLNAERLRIAGVSGRPATFVPPGEPFRDGDQDGVRDADEAWLNLAYPSVLDCDASNPTGCEVRVDASDATRDDGTVGAAAVRNSRGPELAGEAALWGTLFTNGRLEAAGDVVVLGSVVARGGFEHTAGDARFFWDFRIGEAWPPSGWGLPRVFVTRWDTGP